MAKKKEKKAGKRMKKKELVKVLLEFFHTKQDEVLSLKYIFEQLHLTTHPLKMLCMDILSELSMDDYITEVDKHKYKLNNHGVEMTGTFQRKSNGKNSFIPVSYTHLDVYKRQDLRLTKVGVQRYSFFYAHTFLRMTKNSYLRWLL